MDVRNARVLVTGGSSGIGKATAALLTAKGAQVAITGRDQPKLAAVANAIGAHAIDLDQSDYGAIAGGLAEAIATLGGLDAVINNAGVGSFAQVGELQAADFERVLATNVIGLALLTQEAVAHFRQHGGGDIVNIASTAALNGFPGGSVYCASKFALRGMTQCWQKELRKDDIRVILVNPSEVPTAFGSESREERPLEERKLTPVEIAHAIVSALEMDDRGFIPELSVWATNP